MEKIDSFMGVKIEPDINYFVQVANIGIEGKVEGIECGKLAMKEGKEYDLREVIASALGLGLPYNKIPKYDFERREISTASIRVFRRI